MRMTGIWEYALASSGAKTQSSWARTNRRGSEKSEYEKQSHDETPIASAEPWFAVKCLFSHPSRASDVEKVLYEERVTLWRASSWDEASRLAEAEAQEYASSDDCVFHFATDAFHLFDESVGHRTEIWSTIRGSGMDPETYKQTFCATPRVRIGNHRE